VLRLEQAQCSAPHAPKVLRAELEGGPARRLAADYRVVFIPDWVSPSGSRLAQAGPFATAIALDASDTNTLGSHAQRGESCNIAA